MTMNARLLELYKQSFDVEEQYPAVCNGYPDIVHTFNADKFAELIIRHCATAAKKWQRWNDESAIKVNIDQIILTDFDLPE